MRYRFSQPEDFGDRNARLAGDGWSGHAAKSRLGRQLGGPTLRELGAWARRFPVVKPEERKP